METKTKERYYLLDAIRGLAILAMITYHCLWDLVNIYGVSIPWFGSTSAYILQRSIRWCFILLAGFCFSLGGRPVKRGLLTLACSVVITLVSLVAIPDAPIHFGVLTLIGTGTLLTALANPLGKKCNPYIGFLLCLVLFLLTENISHGRLWTLELPRWLYANFFTALLGFPHAGFYSSDYVPLIPWLFSYWMGYFAYGIFKKHNLLKLFSAFRIKLLELPGRHSLLIYMAHQPLVYGILALIFMCIRK